MGTNETPSIPYDMYETPQEIFLIIPLGGVQKESIEINIEDYKIVIKGMRAPYDLKESCIAIHEECYRGPIQLTIDLPPQVYFDRIHSKLTLANILEIIIPKAIIPKRIELEVEYETD